MKDGNKIVFNTLGLLEYWISPTNFTIGSYHGDKGRREVSLPRLEKKNTKLTLFSMFTLLLFLSKVF